MRNGGSFFSLRRLGALLMKEFIQMRRDRITFAMMLGVPLMQLILFGYAINNDPKGLPAALVTTSNDRFTRAMVSALQVTNYYRFDHVVATSEEAEALMAKGEVLFVVTIPSDFARRVERDDYPTLLIEADATDPSAASGAISTLSTVAQQALLRERGMQAVVDRNNHDQLQIVVHRRYNPEGISQYNIVPGLLGVILQMTMVMMTAMALTRETERGTMENLLAMPASPRSCSAKCCPISSSAASRWRSCSPRPGHCSAFRSSARCRCSCRPCSPSSWRWSCSAIRSRQWRARRCRPCSSPSSSSCRRCSCPASCSLIAACRYGRSISARSSRSPTSCGSCAR
jgi:hypothetical protein